MFTHLLADDENTDILSEQQQQLQQWISKEEAVSLFCKGFYTVKLLSFVVT